MPGPAPPIVNGLQIDQSLDFQRRFQRIQTIAWRVLALVPVAAVAGLFGGGLFSEVTADGGGASVSYDRFGRRSVDTELQVTVKRVSSPVTVAISRDLMDGYDVSEIRPQPQRVAAYADRLVYQFAARPGASISFTVQPQTLGSTHGTVTVAGARPVELHQLVYP